MATEGRLRPCRRCRMPRERYDWFVTMRRNGISIRTRLVSSDFRQAGFWWPRPAPILTARCTSLSVWRTRRVIAPISPLQSILDTSSQKIQTESQSSLHPKDAAYVRAAGRRRQGGQCSGITRLLHCAGKSGCVGGIAYLREGRARLWTEADEAADHSLAEACRYLVAHDRHY